MKSIANLNTLSVSGRLNIGLHISLVQEPPIYVYIAQCMITKSVLRMMVWISRGKTFTMIFWFLMSSCVNKKKMKQNIWKVKYIRLRIESTLFYLSYRLCDKHPETRREDFVQRAAARWRQTNVGISQNGAKDLDSYCDGPRHSRLTIDKKGLYKYYIHALYRVW